MNLITDCVYNVLHVIRAMGLKVYQGDFNEDKFGRMLL